ncbi:MAG: PorT family protein [Deinococcales bacterium]|nr:PorT family protein [Chitinophagaceae bacterium]
MKKIVFSSLAIVLFAIATNAQGFRAGIKVGANGTKIDGQSFEVGYKLSYQAGVFFEADFNKKFGIQPEVLFGQTSSRTVTGINAAATNLNSSQDVNLNYLSIPVLLRYNVGKIVTLNLGPQFSILLNKDNTLLQNGQQAFKSGDFAMVGGVQLNFSVLRIYGRYNVGLSNINDVDNQEKWKSQQIQLGVGFKL